MKGLFANPNQRLIGTILTGKPKRGSLFVPIFTAAFVMLISQMYWLDLWGLARWMPANRHEVYGEFQFWRLLTAVFIHGDIAHYLSNIYMISFFSFFVYGYYGSKLFPWLSLIGAVLANAIAIWTYDPQVNLIGASGLVFVLWGIWLSLYFCIQRQHTVFSRLLRIVGISLLVLFPSTFEPNVSYRTHFIGFVVGLVIGLGYFQRHKTYFRAYETYKIDDDGEPTFH